MTNRFRFAAFLLLAILLTANSVFAGATITIVNLDGPGEGFNDPTPAQPVGGNMGTTVGAQRLIAFQEAARIWSLFIDSGVEIKIDSSFDPLSCNATAATLGSAGTQPVSAGFAGAEFPNTWYHGALANKISGVDRSPTLNDIRARFNSSLGGTNPNGTPCFTGGGWYYGLDGNHGTKSDLVVVLLHEFGHGLGFATFMNTQTGALFNGLPDVFNRFLFDNSLGKGWTDSNMSNAERAASAINQFGVVFTSPGVTSHASSLLRFASLVRINSPASLAGGKPAQDATFGAPVTAAGVTGQVVQAIDALETTAGSTTTDGCSAINASVAGKIALIDRGVCGFIQKVKNAQNAGAIAAIIVNNTPGGLPGMGGDDPTITITSLGISQSDGNAIKAQLATGVTATLQSDASRRQGSDALGRVFVNTPSVFVAGSSVSHFDPIATPNLLMEPNINGDLQHALDLTLDEMRDIGWFPDQDTDLIRDSADNCPTIVNPNQANNDGDSLGDACDPDDDNDGVADTLDNCPLTANADQANFDHDASGDVCDNDDDNDGVLDAVDAEPFSDLRPTVVIDGCDSGAPNIFFADGTTISDRASHIARASRNHGDFVSAFGQYLDGLKKNGQLTGAQKAAIDSCAARSSRP